MGHKSSPEVLRLGITKDWMSRWFGRKNYQENLEEDFLIRNVLFKKFSKASIEKILIERQGTTTKVIIRTSRPGLLIGRSGQGAELIKKEVEKVACKKRGVTKKLDFKIEIEEIRNPFSHAEIVAQNIADQIERRVPHRRVLKQTLEKVKAAQEVKGVKIMVKGRLDGKEIARDAWLKEGSLPLQTFRADVDFAKATAYTTYGTVGIKVWLYKKGK